MIEICFKANSPAELKLLIRDYMSEPEPLPLVEVPEIKPVITQEQMEVNVANAPAHELPPVPTLEEVRAALKSLRDRKGVAKVKEILKAYGAEDLPGLAPENYLGVIDRANVEV